MSRHPVRLTERGRLILELVILAAWIVAVCSVAYIVGGPAIFQP